MRLLLISSVLLAVTTGCASSTVIRTNPSGATVRSHTGSVLGKTPYVHSDTQLVGHTERFTVEMPGYEERQVVVSKSQWNTGRIVGFGLGGLFFPPVWAGLLWAQEYAPEYEVKLEPESEARTADQL